MITFRTNLRLNELTNSKNIIAINNISNTLFNVDFSQLSLNDKNIVFNTYLETIK